MAKGTTGRPIKGSRQRRASPYPLISIKEPMDSHVKDSHAIIEKNDWEDATCSVCMEYPHNAVLLLCSSYDKGCRPYMCGTSFRHSNCLNQYKKHTKVALPHHNLPHHDTTEGLAIGPLSSWNMDNSEAVELPCPLCRGQVKGWTVVKPAREYLNTKRRSCMQENCSFAGTYKELRKHVRVDHPSARPHKVDPLLKQKWRQLVHDQERDDVISTIRSSMPGAVVFGDYVIEPNNQGLDSDEEEDTYANTMELNEDFDIGIDSTENNFMNMLLFLQAFNSAGNISSNRVARRVTRDTNLALNERRVGLTHGSAIRGANYFDQDSASGEDIQGNGGLSLINRPGPHGRSPYYSDQDGDSDAGIRALGSNGGVSLVNRLRRSGRRRRHRIASRILR